MLVSPKLSMLESTKLDQDRLYGSVRHMAKQQADYRKLCPDSLKVDWSKLASLPVQKEVAGCGFFQLYRRRILYPSYWPDAAGCDTTFVEYFTAGGKTAFGSVITLPEVRCVHLGLPFVNWKGRKSEVWTV